MKAILSDIHANLEALQAVLADMASHHIESIYCLGDVVGYGPNPRECLELSMQWDVVLLGFHEHQILSGPAGYDASIARKISWTRRELFDSPEPEQIRQGRLDFVQARH